MSRRPFLAPVLLLVACSGDPSSPAEPDLREAAGSAAAAGSWIARAAYPTPIWEAASVSVTDPTTLRTRLYVIGGKPKEFASPGNITSAVKVYDAATNKWQSRAPYPLRIRNPAAAELNGKIYVSGGSSRVFDESHGVYRSSPSLQHHVYDIAANRWTRKRDIPSRAHHPVSAAYQGMIYVAAGCQSEALCGDLPGGAIWRYNPANDTWVLLTRSPDDYRVGGFIGGKFYLVRDLGTLDIYDVASNTWSTGPQRPKRLCLQTSTTLQAKLYLSGLCDDEGPNSVYPTLVFDPKVAAWTEITAAPFGTREYHTLARVWVNGVAGLDLIGGPKSGNHWRLVP
jgi:hypothetical protein